MRIERSEEYREDPPISSAPGRQLVPVEPRSPVTPEAAVDKGAGTRTRFDGFPRDLDIRNLTPRQMAGISLDLYVAGVVSWDEYAMLAFQAELHPDYDRSVGALTGEKAKPDQPRDFVAEWEERLKFEMRHNDEYSRVAEDTSHIVGVLKQIDSPTDLIA